MIESYLEELGRRLRGPSAWRSRLVAEARDHLLESVARLEADGLSPPDAENRALDRFGSAATVAKAANRSFGLKGWFTGLAEPWIKEAEVVPRVLGAVFVLASVYYLAWYATHLSATGSLLAALVLIWAGVMLVLQGRPSRPRAVWFRGAHPVSLQGWLTAVVLLGLALAAFMGVDSQSHSVSDTLGTFVPLLSIITAISCKLVYELGEPSAGIAR